MIIADIKPGEGNTGKIKHRRIAVFNSGEDLSVLDSTCPHMGCEVEWNEDEKTWDCPCHGSRFRGDGTLLEGPAENHLKPLDFRLEGDELILT